MNDIIFFIIIGITVASIYGLIAVGSGTPSFKSGVFRTGFGAYKIIE